MRRANHRSAILRTAALALALNTVNNFRNGTTGVAVGGGAFNLVTDTFGTIAGGNANQVGDDNSVGENRQLNAAYATVGGGNGNHASGLNSTVPGGISNCAGSDYSFAAGRRAKVRRGNLMGFSLGGCADVAGSGTDSGDAGTFVWADSRAANFVSTGPDQFLVRAQGGVGINGTPPGPTFELSVFGEATNADGGFVEFRLIPTPAMNGNTNEGIEIGVGKGGPGSNDANLRIAHRSNTGYAERMNLNSDGSVIIRSNVTQANTGVSMAANAGAWSSLSDRRLKTAIVPVDARAILDRVLDLPMATWSYIAQGEGIRHIGPMAQDFAARFGVGESDTTISTIDADGVALAAIQGLNAKLEAENAALRATLETVLARLDRLEANAER